jgi:hypothetical protein
MKTIENNIEKLPHPTKGTGKWQSLIREMSIGDSFTLKFEEDEHGYIYRAIMKAAYSIGAKVESVTEPDGTRRVFRKS